MADKKEGRNLNVKNVDADDYEYIESTGIPISKFVRMAIKEKRKRDSK